MENNKLLEDYLDLVQENMSERSATILASIMVIGLASAFSVLLNLPTILKNRFNKNTEKAIKDLLVKEQRKIIPGLLRIGSEFNKELLRNVYIKSHDFNLNEFDKKDYEKAYSKMVSDLVKNISRIVYKQKKISINDILRKIEKHNTIFFTGYLLDDIYFNDHKTSMVWIKISKKYNEKSWKMYFQPLLITLIKTLNQSLKQWGKVKK